MNLKTLIRNILDIKVCCDKPHLSIRLPNPGNKSYYEIDYDRMYSAPELTFQKLKALSELFGTDEINVDNYNIHGCETCDWGSDYGHTIQISNPTKNIEELNKLLNKDLINE